MYKTGKPQVLCIKVSGPGSHHSTGRLLYGCGEWRSQNLSSSMNSNHFLERNQCQILIFKKAVNHEIKLTGLENLHRYKIEKKKHVNGSECP